MTAASIHGQRGVALVVVLWLGALLAVVAGSIATGVRTDTLVARQRIGLVDARLLAEAGLVRSLLELAQPPGAEWRNGKASQREFALPGGQVAVRLRPASGLLDLNRSSAVVIGGLLTALGVGDERREQLVDAILDWRDRDDLRRLKGAEAADYRAAGLAYGPRDGALLHIDEVRQVLGMDGELFERLRPHLTLWSPVAQPNPRYATRPLLMALMDQDAARVDDYLALRDSMAGSDAAGPWRLEIEARAATGGRARLEVVVRLKGEGEWQVLNWYNGWSEDQDG